MNCTNQRRCGGPHCINCVRLELIRTKRERDELRAEVDAHIKLNEPSKVTKYMAEAICLEKERDALKAELDAANERLYEERRDAYRDQQELARCWQIERARLRAALESLATYQFAVGDKTGELVKQHCIEALAPQSREEV